MTNLGFSLRGWLVRHQAALGACALAFGLATSGGCAKQDGDGLGGAGGAGTGSTTTTTTTTTTSTTGTGGAGGGGTGGASGMTTSSSSSSTTSSSSSSTTSSSSSTSSTSSSSGTGTGGSGGGFMEPVGTADYPAEMEQNNLKSTANLLPDGAKGFSAAIYPVGDVDVFSFAVTEGGTSVAVSTSNGMGGCPAGASMVVRVFDENNSLLASDSSGGCPHLTPNNDSGLAGLPVGKYYVHIESATINPIPYYVLDIKLSAPGCGDGIVQLAAGEQCDDDNTTSGDGCSATCQLESGNYLNETEPNDTQATGNLLDGYAGAVGQIMPTGDTDWYTFNVTSAGSSVIAEIGDGFGSCPSGFDSKIYLYGPSMTQLAADDDDGVSPCSKISPDLYPAATILPVGLYAIKVTYYNNSGTAPFYVLKLKVAAPGCGDSILQTGEQCDDGNTTAGDGCSPTCQFEKNYVPEAEVNDTQALANPLPAGADGFIASIQPAGDQDYFSFDVTVPGSSVTINTGDGLNGCPANFDSKIYLYDPTHTQIAVNDDGVNPHCSTIAPGTTAAAANLAVGTYYLRVERYGNAATQPQYVVTIKVSAPGCGDGILQTGEQCDDGNTTSGDGCSSTCMAEAPYEIEPNNTYQTATPLWAGTSTWKGSINPVGDHDYYSFTLTAPGSPRLVTHDAGNPNSCGFDTYIYLLNSNGTEIAHDDDNGPSSCSEISKMYYAAVQNLPAGTYYVWVQRYNDSQTIPLYQLDLTIQ